MAVGKSLKAACRDAGVDLSFYLHRERDADEPFPWEILDQVVTRHYLHGEYHQALAAEVGTVCAPGCNRCGMEC